MVGAAFALVLTFTPPVASAVFDAGAAGADWLDLRRSVGGATEAAQLAAR
ncbi:hypothetical protein JNW88_22675 [Micromonospora sp. ATA32]|nr:hypothetical protein [Micromonospora sp. ATA32]